MKTIIMCSPESFDVNYSINPWMEGNIGNVKHSVATAQWQNLHDTLVKAGAEVQVMPKAPENCPDAVFTANAGNIFNNTFIPSRFRFEERAAEEPFFINWFAAHGYTVLLDVPDAARTATSFEGAGDALFSHDRSKLWLGTGFRTSLSYKPFLEQLLELIDGTENVIVRPLELVDPRFYHLDTCFCPLDTGEILWYPPAFSEYSQHVIEQWYGDKAIAVNDQDAERFACNAVSIGSTIVMSIITPHLEQRLKSRGYTVYQCDMSQFLRSGGSCKCLTIEVI